MEKIAKFEKVSFLQYQKDAFSCSLNSDVLKIYEGIELPRRATKGSAGYDFKAPFDFTLQKGETITIPSGIRVSMKEGWFLALFPRSGFGFKYRLRLNNTVGIIDSDYYFSDNEGHILIRITNESIENKVLTIHRGEGFVQGILLPFGLADEEEIKKERNGGFGSTD